MKRRPKLKDRSQVLDRVGGPRPRDRVLTWVSLNGLGRIDTEVESLFDRNLTALEAVDSVTAEIFQVEELLLLEDLDEARREEAEEELVTVTASIDREIKLIERLYTDVPPVLASAKKLDKDWAAFERRREAGDFRAKVKSDEIGESVAQERIEQQVKVAEAADGALRPLETEAQDLRNLLRKRREERRADIEAAFSDTQRLMLIGGAVAVLLGFAVIGWLVRDVAPRVRRYSSFAASVAEGDLTARLEPKGSDELAELASHLNQMVEG